MNFSNIVDTSCVLLRQTLFTKSGHMQYFVGMRLLVGIALNVRFEFDGLELKSYQQIWVQGGNLEQFNVSVWDTHNSSNTIVSEGVQISLRLDRPQGWPVNTTRTINSYRDRTGSLANGGFGWHGGVFIYANVSNVYLLSKRVPRHPFEGGPVCVQHTRYRFILRFVQEVMLRLSQERVVL